MSRFCAGALRWPAVLLLSWWLAACAVQPPDEGAARIDEYLAARDLPSPQGEPLTVAGELGRDQAVRLALTRHPAVAVEYQQLDIAAADVMAAGQLDNPRLSLSLMYPHGGGDHDTGIGIAQGFAGLLLRPARIRMAEDQYQQAALRISSAVQQLAVDAEEAWYALVTAEQALLVQEQVTRAAQLRAELAARFAGAGNLPAMELAALQRDAAEAQLALLRQRQARDSAKAVLGELIDAPPDAQWSVPAALPLPSHHEPSAAALTDMALSRRLDLQALQLDSTLFDDNLTLARRYRWLGELELGVEHEREGDGTRKTGPSLSFSLPLFHRNQAGVRRAEAQQREAQARERQLDQEIRHRVRALHASLLLSRQAFAVQRDILLPALTAVVEQRQKRVNYMLDGVFELLADKQAELVARREQVSTLGDYWQVRTALSRTVGSGLPLMSMGVLDTDGTAPPMDHGHGAHH
ncbi:outer membrane efflux protein [Alcanivorax sp. S71-1-4]|uniref:TolC family protein n=1 Tax=Alcanivorax sp. S71-1-4 TaxID=1177159 RepID=UPI001357BA07|nr:TolC family protein [Alcanivorax sp. S71-1-4]KAF0808255.1 outer membrane efflux protein [Alcanivorax sp. S71-1-4]